MVNLGNRLFLCYFVCSKICVFRLVIVGYCRLYTENKEKEQKKENGTFCILFGLTRIAHVFTPVMSYCSGVFLSFYRLCKRLKTSI